MNDTDLVNAELAARATGLNKFFIYKLAAAGKLPSYRAGRALRFSIPELRDWMRHEAEKRQAVGVNVVR